MQARFLLLVLALSTACRSSEPIPEERLQPTGPFPAELAELRPLEGLLDLYVDDAAGQAWLVLPATENGGSLSLLYAEGLTTGLGSNPVGLDRGQLGPARVVSIRTVGKRVLVETPSARFRAETNDAEEARATAESFATSVLWAGEIAARDEEGRALVDFTSFLVRDAHGVAETLQATGQGRWTLDEGRSTFDPGASLSFPDNVELEAILTFRGDDPGAHVRATSPDAHAVTLVQHHSFIRLPDDGYRPRPHDPRLGAIAVEYLDYATPLRESVHKRLAVRLRLQSGDAFEPIVYYVDRGAPEPVRSALVEGAGWWQEAFAAAGFPDGFRVELLPEDVHPLDARYNVIEWVHRSTRGWSYGGGIVDPRTGEVVKGHVSLGSLRVRQDRLLFEGLLGTGRTGSGGADDPVELALARIRQLSAHEVGHTIGLSHNFAASTYDGRASVMDYPAPLVRVRGDDLDVSEAYAVGVGSWDVHAIRALYAECPPGEGETAFLDRMAREGLEAGQLFLTDADARPAGAAHPLANLWDNGEDPVAELDRVMEVRRFALDRFGEHCLAAGRPRAELQEVLVPVYFHHRYQLDATAKLLGGFTYRHALAGDGRDAIEPVPAAQQRAALEALVRTLDPAELDLHEDTLRLLAPRAPETSRNREMFASTTEPGVDPLGIARAAAKPVFANLLQAERLNRLADFETRTEGAVRIEEVTNALAAAVAPYAGEGARHAAIRRAVRHTLYDEWMAALVDPRLANHVEVRLETQLEGEAERLAEGSAVEARLAAKIRGFLEHRWTESRRSAPGPELPPGSPIGSGATGRGVVDGFGSDGPFIGRHNSDCAAARGFGSQR